MFLLIFLIKTRSHLRFWSIFILAKAELSSGLRLQYRFAEKIYQLYLRNITALIIEQKSCMCFDGYLNQVGIHFTQLSYEQIAISDQLSSGTPNCLLYQESTQVFTLKSYPYDAKNETQTAVGICSITWNHGIT